MRQLLLSALLLLIAFQAMGQPEPGSKRKITYVMDPHCGWCFGNGENILALKEAFQDEIDFEILVGGMWLGENAPAGGASLSQFIEEHGPGLEEATGVQLGKGYHDLTRDPDYVFSSLEPGAAVVLVKQLKPEAGFGFAKDLQHALFVEGKRLDQLANYLPLLEKYGIDAERFQSQWLSEANLTDARQEFSHASSLVSGFPTILLEETDGFKVLAAGYLDLEEAKALIKAAL